MTDWIDDPVNITLTVLFIVAVIFVLALLIIKPLINKKRRYNTEKSMNLRKQRITYLEHHEEAIKGRGRLNSLQDSMKKLVKEHPTIGDLDEAYNFINQYFKCRGQEEYKYCKDYLKKLYYKGYYRYDDERLR